MSSRGLNQNLFQSERVNKASHKRGELLAQRVKKVRVGKNHQILGRPRLSASDCADRELNFLHDI